MKTKLKKDETVLTISVEGSIDTVTAPDLETELQENFDGITEMVLDLTDVSFISSAGLRVFLWAHKQMLPHGRLVIKNIKEDVWEVFELTGLDSILNFE